MANTLGGLVVTLGLNAVEFTAGLTKSEYEARKFAKRVEDNMRAGAQAIATGVAAAGVAAAGAFAALAKQADSIGKFKTLSEQIGDTANAVAGLQLAAATSGVEIEAVAGLSVKLTKALSEAGAESDDIGQALAALGINFRDFKSLSPVAQLEAVAKTMARFGDGAGKTAVAIALFKKEGAAAIPFLNDLAEQGGRNERLTRDQIDAADKFGKELAKLRAEAQLALQVFASDWIPTVLAFIKSINEAVAAVGGFQNALIGFTRINPFSDTETNLASLRRQLDEAERAKYNEGSFSKFFNDITGKSWDKTIAGLKATIGLLESRQAQAAFHRSGIPLAESKKPQLNFTSRVSTGSGGAAQISEAERYLESLAKQIERTKDLSAVELARLEIARFKKAATPDEERRIFALAAELDLQRAIKEQEEERKKVEQEAARAREQASRLQDKIIDDRLKAVDALRQENQRIEENIVFLTGGEEAVRAMERARLASAIAIEEETLAMLQNAGASQLEIAAVKEHINVLKERSGLIDQVDIAEKMRIEVEKLQDLKDSFSDALVQPLVDFVNQTKSAKDAFKSFIKSIEQMLAQKAARGIADWLFGGKTQSGFDFGTIFKLFGGMFGGGSSFMNVIDTVPPVFGGFAHGTSFAPGGRAWVGEQGPELVDLPRGARVIPNKAAMALGGQSMVFNVNVMPGADTRSAKQVGGVLRDTVIRAIKDR